MKKLLMLLILLPSLLEASIYRYNYRVVHAQGATWRIPQFILADTEAELPVTNVIEGDSGYAKDTDKFYTYDGATWNAGGGGGGAPTNAEYWVGAPHVGLSAEHDLSALGGGLIINNAGAPLIYLGQDCGTSWVHAINQMGTVSCTLPTFSVIFGTITTAQITDDAVTYAKMQDIAAGTVIGNPTGVSASPTGVPVDPVGGGIGFSGGNLILNVPVTIPRGGTGQITAQAAINALSNVAGATNEHVLTKDTGTGNAIFKAVSGGGSHNLLSATHTDTIAATPPAAGSMLAANGGGSVWHEFPIGTDKQILSASLAGLFPVVEWITPSYAPNDAEYWTGAAHSDLTAEKNLGALSTALVINTAGVPSAYTGTSCTGSDWLKNITATGAGSCGAISFSNLGGAATIAQGGTTETASTEDAVLVGASTTDWVPKVLPDSDAVEQILQYDTTTNAFSVRVREEIKRLYASSALSTVTLTSLSGLSFTLAANTIYGVDCMMMNSANAATVGVSYGATFSGTVNLAQGILQHPASATTLTWIYDSTFPWVFGALASQGNKGAVSKITGEINVSGTGGTLQFQHASETATLTTTFVGSRCRVWRY